ncbi:hypothetical protein H5410_033679 [Solanum commersonii]|uniref:Uncharacterized protein n=1 Tax=Solanum commersonii TaxID=4109 RepID=A0A9J5YQX4_SOLCO|nr:hypothetical protein H5410_033679 [Solanum commersonii]
MFFGQMLLCHGRCLQDLLATMSMVVPATYGGFVKETVKYMVMDDLVVKPLSISNIMGHTSGTCYRLHGYPANFKHTFKKKSSTSPTTGRGGTAHYAAGDANSQWNRNPASDLGGYAGGSINTPNVGSASQFGEGSSQMTSQGPYTSAPHFTPEQYHRLLYLLDQDNESNGTALSASSISNYTTFSTGDFNWIVDTGATHHMVNNHRILFDAKSCSNSRSGNVSLPTSGIAKIFYGYNNNNVYDAYSSLYKRSYNLCSMSVTDAICPCCRKGMSKKMNYIVSEGGKGVVATKGGFVKEAVMYMVMDDLVVKPMSVIFSVTLLNKFKVKDVGVLQEKIVYFGMKEVFNSVFLLLFGEIIFLMYLIDSFEDAEGIY